MYNKYENPPFSKIATKQSLPFPCFTDRELFFKSGPLRTDSDYPDLRKPPSAAAEADPDSSQHGRPQGGRLRNKGRM
jgi:hypothetical protein